ncbi:MAG: T9SS type A sorting domain-containing protein [Bacteroidetes bacterium]|nr:T9SS type A sorting domain-containing protein [Bacteroidota bacterium]
MRKLLLISLISLFAGKINAQCLTPVNSITENFNAPPPSCWFPIGATYVSGAVKLSTFATGGSKTIILPMTDNAKGILEFDIINTTNSNPTIQLLIGTVSNQSAGAMSTFQLIKSHPVPMAQSGGFIVYAHHIVDLSTYTGNQQFIALSISQSALNPNLSIDNLSYNSACISTSVTAVAQNYTVQLNNSGLVNITPANINNGSTSDCGTPTLSLNKTFFDCSNIGVNTVTLTAIDSGSNTASTTANVTILPAINNETISTTQNNVCSGNSATITTSSSNNGIKYYLRDDANNNIIGSPVTGTGSALSFNTGALIANTTFNVYAETQGGGNYGLDFDGTNDVINTNITTPATNSLTIEAWIFPRATTYKRIVSNYFANTDQSGEIILDTYNTTNNGRGLRLVVEGAGNTLHQLTIANVLTLNAWNHVAGTFSNGVTKIYVNGTAVATSTAPFTSIPSCANPISIGEDPTILTSEYFNGKMDEVRIWTTARTQAEISGNMNNCLVGNESGLRNYFKLNENTGSTISDLITGAPGNMSGMTPSTAWVSGNVNCGASTCNLEMTDLVTITIAPNPTIAVNSGTICSGNSFTITPSGANTYSIQGGSSVKTPTANTSYTVVGTNSVGCVSSTFATSSVTVNSLPSITATSDDALICAGETASLTVSGTSTSYTWNTSATGTSISVSPTVTTNYTVTGTDANGCENNAVITQSVSLCTGINQLSNSTNELSIFPNPSSTNLTVKTDEEIQTISIYNSLGALVQTEKTNVFSVEQLSSGLYILKVKTEKGTTTIRFIKE